MIEARFAAVMETFRLPPGCTVTVALSGGRDSVTLLYLLHTMPNRPFQLAAAHVNHGLRGEEALRDQRFCEQLCTDWGIPFRCFSGDARAYAQTHGQSIEEGARGLRYGFLDALADGTSAFVATAHHRDDQLETFFINLYRGSGSGGLRGIPARRNGYLRPLLDFSREELTAFAEARRLPFVTDETNGDTAYLRNFLRTEVLPLLCSRPEGNFAKGLTAAMDCLRAEDEALSQWADRVPDTRQQTLAALPEAVLKRVLDRVNGQPLSRVHFAAVQTLIQSNAPAGQVQLSDDRYFRLEYGNCVFVTPTQDLVIPIQPGTPVTCGEWCFSIRFAEINSPFTHFSLDCDKIKGDLVFRHKKEGDRFCPVGSGGSSRLQKRLKNDRVPRSERDQLWVLANGDGNLLWVEGYGADRAFCCGSTTRKALEIEIVRIGT